MDNMKFNEFIDYVREHIFDARPELQTTCEISVNQVNKNNGLQLTGLTIREEHTNIAPAIYLDGYFKDYENGRDIDSVVGEVFKIYENSAGEAAKGFDTEFLAKLENVEDRMQRGKDQMEAKASEKPSKPIIDKPEQGKEIN